MQENRLKRSRADLQDNKEEKIEKTCKKRSKPEDAYELTPCERFELARIMALKKDRERDPARLCLKEMDEGDYWARKEKATHANVWHVLNARELALQQARGDSVDSDDDDDEIVDRLSKSNDAKAKKSLDSFDKTMKRQCNKESAERKRYEKTKKMLNALGMSGIQKFDERTSEDEDLADFLSLLDYAHPRRGGVDKMEFE